MPGAVPQARLSCCGRGRACGNRSGEIHNVVRQDIALAKWRETSYWCAMLDVLVNPIIPVFAILAVGFILGKCGWYTVEEARVLNRFAIRIPLPAMGFNLLVAAPVDQFQWSVLGTYHATELCLYAASALIARHVFARDWAEAVLIGMVTVFVNHFLYVLPITLYLHGEAGALPVTAAVAIDSAIVFSATMVLIEAIQAGRVRLLGVTRSILTNPIILSGIAGLGINLSGMTPPAPLLTFTGFIGQAAAPIALFALGVVLSASSIFGRNPAVWFFASVKLLAMPLILWLALARPAPGSDWPGLLLLTAAGPSGAMAFSIAMLYRIRTDTIAPIIVWTSVLSLITMAFLA